MLGDNHDLTLRRLRNQWAKERAVLEQENHLLSLNLLEVKGRETSLKRVNSTLVNSIDFGKQSTTTKLQCKLARLEEENRQLRLKLNETSMEKKQIEDKQQKLKVDNACMRQRTHYQLKEAKKLKEKYQNQLRKLEQEFEKLRYSNDHLLDAFRNSMLTTKNDEAKDEKCRCDCPRSSDCSDVIICADCVEEEISPFKEGKCCLSSKASRNHSSSQKKGSKCSRHDFFRNDLTQEPNLSSEIKRSMHENAIQKGSFLEVFSLNSTSQGKFKPNFTVGTSRRSINNDIATVKNKMNTFSRVNTESEYTSNVQMFKHKRKSTLGCLGTLSKPLKVEAKPEQKPPGIKQLDFQVQDEKPLQKGPLFLNTASLRHLKERGCGNPLSSMRMDYSNRNPTSSRLNRQNSREEITSLDYNVRLSEAQELLSSDRHHSSKKEPTLATNCWRASLRSDLLITEEEKENEPELSTRLSKSNIFRSMNVKDSVQDCLNFNEVLREKLANIEKKLKFKITN